ncbi:flagellar biosynthesis repressor FlbT [Pikeienuella piscinae]|uniref:Flagellar biosynthesis repressor FlbT n=1 Tax=Pikeienuella piscinae TaxID=2748098 RepID=A0A7L5BX69_9RHOB|nr:flagellar biosynthesis repressor FlbT [Pikeienuella piscinae]QIE56980.1 flagellar biosynthesis repressor FlbT [Pikeienuella piscinae]
MPGLILKLAPGERFVANGVVIENGDRRARLNILTPDSNVLRLRDALHPEEANTPVRRVCYIIQLVLAGEANEAAAKRQISDGIRQLAQVFTDAESSRRLTRAAEDVSLGRFYPALRGLRAILPMEDRLMAMNEERMS